MIAVSWTPFGDGAILLRFPSADSRDVWSAFAAIERAAIAPIRNLHPAYASLLIELDPLSTEAEPLAAEITELLSRVDPEELPAGKLVEVPVCYGGEHGPDLAAVAEAGGLTVAEATRRHSEREYRVAFLGFQPGFAYLSGLPEGLFSPRLAVPRLAVPAGSVGIAGGQTGIYPFRSPGGWRIVGRTPLALFRPDSPSPTLLRMGDRVVFRPEPKAVFSSAPASPVGSAAPAVAAVEVLQGGPMTTVQDLGRYGWAHLGISAGGAADPVSLRLANRLVGNPEGTAGLEMTLRGGHFRFLQATWIGLAGADFQARWNGRPIAPWRSYRLASGDELELGGTRGGARAYLALRGGIALPPWLGSHSTLVGAGAGGLSGRGLRAGDRLPLGDAAAEPAAEREALDLFPEEPVTPLRILPGDGGNGIGAERRDEWLAQIFEVSEQSNRAGLRLKEPALPFPESGEQTTEGVIWGTVQVTPSGQGVILMNDQQTTGGYPRIAQVIAADWPRLGRLRPGAKIRWQSVTVLQAREALRELEDRIRSAVRER
jgi:KipI family sensor histidine kinase inhibitor